MGAPHSDLFILLINLNWHNCLDYLSKTDSFTLGTGYRFAWYGLAHSCNYISTVLFFHVPNVPSNRNWYLDSRLCNASCSSSLIFLLFDATLFRSNFLYLAYNIKCVRCVESSTCYLYHSSLFQNFSPWLGACCTMSSSHIANRLIPRLWCPYLVNSWELASSVPVVTYWKNEDTLIPTAGYVLIWRYILSSSEKTDRRRIYYWN